MGLLLITSALYIVLATTAIVLLAEVTTTVNRDIMALSSLEEVPPPCALATPSLALIFYGMGWTSYPASGFLENDDAFVGEATDALCLQPVNEAMGELFLANTRSEALDALWTETDIEAAVCENSKLSGEKLLHLQGQRREDPLVRIAQAYIASLPAFAHHAPRSRSLADGCLWSKHPLFDASECANADLIRSELEAAATAGFDDALPSVSTMLYRLTALGVLSRADHEKNSGACFQNKAKRNASELCEEALLPYASSASSPPPSAVSPPPPSPQLPLSFFDPVSGRGLRRCIDERLPPPPPPPAPAVAFELNVEAHHDDATAACVKTHGFGVFDATLLFGMPNFEKHVAPEPQSTGFFGFVGRSAYTAQRDAWFVQQRRDGALASPQAEATLFAAYRLAATAVWTTPAAACAGYWLARGVVPFFVSLLPLLRVRPASAPPLVRPPIGLVHTIAILSTLLTSFYMLFSDPFAVAVYQRPTCDDGDARVWKTSADLRRAGVTAATFVFFVAAYGILHEFLLRAVSRGQKRVARDIALAALVAVCVVIVFDVLLLVDTSEAFVKLVQKVGGTDTAQALKSTGEQVARDAATLLTDTALLSAGIGVLLSRWAVIDGSILVRVLWMLLGVLFAGLPVLIRWQTTETELRAALGGSSANARKTAHWAAVAGSGTVAAVAVIALRRAPPLRPRAVAAAGPRAPPPVVQPVPRSWRRFFGRGTAAALPPEQTPLVAHSPGIFVSWPA